MICGSLWAVYVPFIPAYKKRFKERNTLDVIPMRVADYDIPAQVLGAARHQLLS